MYVYESQKLTLCVFLDHISVLFFKKFLLRPKLTDGTEWPAAPPGPGNLLVLISLVLETWVCTTTPGFLGPRGMNSGPHIWPRESSSSEKNSK